MTVTFVDAGVLIAAARGRADVFAQAMAILDDPERSFASSEFVRLQVLPKAIFNKKSQEAEFYNEFFRAVAHWPHDIGAVVSDAYDKGVTYGLATMDALHVAALSLLAPTSSSQLRKMASRCFGLRMFACGPSIRTRLLDPRTGP